MHTNTKSLLWVFRSCNQVSIPLLPTRICSSLHSTEAVPNYINTSITRNQETSFSEASDTLASATVFYSPTNCKSTLAECYTPIITLCTVSILENFLSKCLRIKWHYWKMLTFLCCWAVFFWQVTVPYVHYSQPYAICQIL